MLFFHGNAEDLGIARPFLNQIRKSLRISILAVEYAGYGLFEGKKSSDGLLTDCLTVFDYLTNEMKVAQEDVILFGRSIGSTPACYIA